MTNLRFWYRELTIPQEWAEKIWSILEDFCGAHESNKMSFVISCQDEEYPVTEFLFQGYLGFGGKFWNSADGWTVNCYREDLTETRKKVIARANIALHLLFMEYARSEGVDV